MSGVDYSAATVVYVICHFVCILYSLGDKLDSVDLVVTIPYLTSVDWATEDSKVSCICN